MFREWFQELDVLDRCIIIALSNGMTVANIVCVSGLSRAMIYSQIDKIRRSYRENFS